MEYKDYPHLFRAADEASEGNQNKHLRTIKFYLICLISGSLVSYFGIENSYLAIIAALFFIASLWLTYIIANRKYENQWYNCRALAESIKTSTWKYMMRAEPYEDADDIKIPRSSFRDILSGLLKENKDLSYEFGVKNQGGQVTHKMNEVRSSSLEERKEFYLKKRIDDQRKWYAKEAKANKNKRKWWLLALIGFNILALICVLFRIYYPGFELWPVEILSLLAGACLTWIQVKKFQELASAYSLTAHEISLLRGEIENVENEPQFSDFVNDSENAFSREHTQWLAKRAH